MSHFVRIICLFLGLFCSVTDSDGCSCAVRTGETYFSTSSNVFFGQILSVQYPTEIPNSLIYTFKVIETYKGNLGETVTIVHTNWYLNDSCTFHYQIGQSYLVYAYEHEGQLVAGACSGTKRLESASEDFLELGLGPLPKSAEIPVPHIKRTATAFDADFNRDSEVDFSDFVMFADAFGSDGGVFDLDFSGRVNFVDFIQFALLYGQKTESPRSVSVKISDTDSIEFVFIKPGSFIMGTTPEQQVYWENLDAWSAEYNTAQPAHVVTISKGFYLSKSEITQAQWRALLGTSPWMGKSQVVDGDDYPAVYISWDETQQFIKELNTVAGDSIFRLPTEAEWEYACRANTTTPWWFGRDDSALEEYAWYKKNTIDMGERYAHKVGAKKSNPWGLHDMLGNVWEWVQDGYLPDVYSVTPRVDPVGPDWASRFIRGGSYDWGAGWIRPSFRNPIELDHITSGPNMGFRLLMMDK